MSDQSERRRVPTYTHWGAYEVEVAGEEILAVHPYAGDPDASPRVPLPIRMCSINATSQYPPEMHAVLARHRPPAGSRRSSFFLPIAPLPLAFRTRAKLP